jgi:rRNA biogenesis protein RRP5
LSDKEVDKIEKKFDIGDKVRCRVVGFSYLDGLANVTLKKSQIEEPLMRYEDIKVGEVVNGTISHVHKRGMEIKITKSIKAFCPLSHLADVIPSDPESRFKVGAQVSCRVLSADPKRRQVVVTHKKSLVKSELPLIADWNKIVVDSFSHGYIVAVKDFGCIVGFYGDVKGKVAKSELSNHFVENPKALFKVGQVMKCRVVNVDPIRRKLNVSFNVRDD